MFDLDSDMSNLGGMSPPSPVSARQGTNINVVLDIQTCFRFRTISESDGLSTCMNNNSRGMGSDRDVEPETQSGRTDLLETYRLNPPAFDGVTMTFESEIEFTLPYYDDGVAEKAYVEIEVKLDEVGVTTYSIDNYLSSYRDAEMSQEDLTCAIRNDLIDTLETGNVFVLVRREYPCKITRIGSIT